MFVLPPNRSLSDLHGLLFLSIGRYYTPRHLLISRLWSPEQEVEFHGLYHSQRAQNTTAILREIQTASSQVKDGRLQSRLMDLCTKVRQCDENNLFFRGKCSD